MTPIKRILWRGVKVVAEDHGGNVRLLALTLTEKDAEWLAWSLGRAHSVPHEKVDSDVLRVLV